ncbi:uncharacterized protein PHACADRAFT_257912 [Phanerochaete carnosa HHB-10118-sp]|uniref:BTB domain-containing protein n=1 Tax=Phanerochaete carnosa (strain HHB-10118-sp) TaxID=650164 RepID=K5VRU0_PHACS|nr:uncharacterized protein PHACADRAFT_257912 [Phanerochaete carnosa HHB-10118-sp]EKM54218.1 hypothetical protein PHACADRAFT_257912 [Phanerochaete carnosa HHB-10118-sp]
MSSDLTVRRHPGHLVSKASRAGRPSGIMQSEGPDVEASAAPLDEPVPVFHELFNSPNADTVLGSKDRVLFRVHSYTLKTTSGWFKDMFSLPQKDRASDHRVDIFLDEDASTLEALLRCVCGLAIPCLESYDVIEPLLFAAEKYDMPGPLSIVRALASTPPLLADSLHLFVLACRYGWDDVAQLAASQTLTLNLNDEKYRPVLAKLMSIPLLNLLALHRGRRDTLRERLNEAPFVSDSVESTCSHCGSKVDYHTWRELKHRIVTEMDVRALGDTVLDPGISDWPEAQRCWAAQCSNCGRVLYDKKETLRAIRSRIEELPTTLSLRYTQEHPTFCAIGG